MFEVGEKMSSRAVVLSGFLMGLTCLGQTAQIIGLALALIALPWIARAAGGEFYIGLASRILVFALAATSLNLILGFGGLVSFGHAAFVGIGAYTVAILAQSGLDSVLLAWPAAVAVAGLVAPPPDSVKVWANPPVWAATGVTVTVKGGPLAPAAITGG